jgi:hypothetical protein
MQRCVDDVNAANAGEWAPSAVLVVSGPQVQY